MTEDADILGYMRTDILKIRLIQIWGYSGVNGDNRITDMWLQLIKENTWKQWEDDSTVEGTLCDMGIL